MSPTTSMPTAPASPMPADSPEHGPSLDPRPRRRRVALSPERRELARQYVPMARNLARRYKVQFPGAWEEFDSGAMLALVEAAEAFDPDRSVKFGTYARRRILGALLDVRRSVRARSRPVRRGVLPEAVLTDRPALLETAGGRAFGIEAEPAVGSRFELREALERLLAALPPREAEACRRLYFFGQTQIEAAAELGLCQARLSQLHGAALARLRRHAPNHLGDVAAA
jgi:RNA polymerase sigma factor (sigma-70 family)